MERGMGLAASRKAGCRYRSGGGAVTGALEDTEIDAPGTDGFAILVGH